MPALTLNANLSLLLYKFKTLCLTFDGIGGHAVSPVPITAVLSYTFDAKEYDFDNQIEANKKLSKLTTKYVRRSKQKTR